MLIIQKPGLLATIQDLGRQGFQNQGIPVGGAADVFHHRLANILLQNPDDAATLEIAGGGFAAVVESEIRLAWSAPASAVFINQKQVENGASARLPAGTLIEIRGSQNHVYTYLAAEKGWDLPIVLGSRSTCLASGFGGLEGRGIAKNDRLTAVFDSNLAKKEVLGGEIVFSKKRISPKIYAAERQEIRFLAGSEWANFSAEQQSNFTSQIFKIGNQSNRMGIRLESSQPLFSSKMEMISMPVLPGTIQIPADGRPIVLMADCQTTGGYPRIGQVILADLWKIAQLPAGSPVRFQLLDFQAAEQLFFEQVNFFSRLKSTLSYAFD